MISTYVRLSACALSLSSLVPGSKSRSTTLFSATLTMVIYNVKQVFWLRFGQLKGFRFLFRISPTFGVTSYLLIPVRIGQS